MHFELASILRYAKTAIPEERNGCSNVVTPASTAIPVASTTSSKEDGCTQLICGKVKQGNSRQTFRVITTLYKLKEFDNTYPYTTAAGRVMLL